MSVPLRVGSRGSALARRQTESTIRSLRRQFPKLEVHLVLMTTGGDEDRRPGTSADFTGTLEDALLSRKIDLAVHSAKDLAAADPKGLLIAAYPRRADPRDCWIARADKHLPRRARVGTSSLRRRAQLLRWRSDLRLVEIRGNVDTRIGLVRDRRLDAIVVAKAGVDRLGRGIEITGTLPVGRFLPAPGQGALALQVRREDRRARALARTIDHQATRASVEAEREVAEALGASCNVPLGAMGRVRGSRLHLSAEVLSADGARSVRAEHFGPADGSRTLGRWVAKRLDGAGARSLIG